MAFVTVPATIPSGCVWQGRTTKQTKPDNGPPQLLAVGCSNVCVGGDCGQPKVQHLGGTTSRLWKAVGSSQDRRAQLRFSAAFWRRVEICWDVKNLRSEVEGSEWDVLEWSRTENDFTLLFINIWKCVEMPCAGLFIPVLIQDFSWSDPWTA